MMFYQPTTQAFLADPSRWTGGVWTPDRCQRCNGQVTPKTAPLCQECENLFYAYMFGETPDCYPWHCNELPYSLTRPAKAG